ncbi:MAG: hypothetical protein KBF76_18190 [Verrucomicrobiales bacterium]|nr:hypothetical protein [Verrucomicrobiales bacterium]
MNLDAQGLNEALSLLGELVAEYPAQHYVICGGSSLLALGLVSRSTTRDVDVLASLENGELSTAKPLPNWLDEAVAKVARDLDLMENWFNTGPSDDSFFRLGLPEGLVTRLTTREFGPTLKVSFIDRYDQIHLKLYATVDSDQGRHFQDLQDLKPTAEELLAAARWTRTQDPSEGFLSVLSAVLNHMNHGNLIDQL